MEDTITLYRPTGPEELELVKGSGYKAWPLRLPKQPIFYPVTNEEYAVQIARDWNVKSSGKGFVTKFQVKAEFMAQFPVKKQTNRCSEFWTPSHLVNKWSFVYDLALGKTNPGRSRKSDKPCLSLGNGFGKLKPKLFRN